MLFVAYSHAQKTADSFSITTLDSLVTSTGSQKSALMDTLAGPLPDTVKSPKNIYLVIGDIEVPINKTVIIGPGTIFLFKNFTGLHVQGKLIAQGTKDRPIIFTSENDRSFNSATSLYPNPFDWNGIYIHPDGVGSAFTFCKVLYSVYGIISETKFVRLNEIVFKQNGKSNLTIEGKETTVTDQAFSNVAPINDRPAAIATVRVSKDPLSTKRKFLRYGGISLASASAATAVYFVARRGNSHTAASGAGLLALVGCVCFACSFLF